MPDVSIVIPQRGHEELTLALVESLRTHEPAAEIVVVNDAPEPCECIGGVVAVASGGRGVTAAWNVGVATATGEFLVLLNNDVECRGPFLHRLPREGIAGAALRVEELIGDEVLEGWCLAFSYRLWASLGGFDEAMRLYYSDADFQVRALDRGSFLTAPRKLPLRHLGHRTAHDRNIISPADRAAQWQADRAIFKRKHA